MADVFKVKVTVESVLKDECPKGFKVGDSWLIEDGITPGGMCASAYYAVYPTVRAFYLGGEHPWEENRDVTHIACPDSDRLLIMEVKRLR
ncbi:TIGR04076 family protein [Chloroflexota bacterium]